MAGGKLMHYVEDLGVMIMSLALIGQCGGRRSERGMVRRSRLYEKL